MDKKDRFPDTQNFEEQYGELMREELRGQPDDYTLIQEEAEQDQETEEEPPKKKKKRRKKHGFLWFCVIVALIAGSLVFINSDFFAISKITVKGNNNYSAAEIVNMCGVKDGDNIFRVRNSSVEKRLKRDSYVAASELERKLPSELVIHVTERREVAYLPYGNKYIIIDSQGYVLNTSDKKPELTMIEGMTIRTMEKGQTLKVRETANLKTAVSIVKLMKEHKLFFKKVDVGNVVAKVYIYDDLLCRGTPQNIRRSIKNGNLEEIVYDLYNRKVKTGTVNIGSGKYCSYSPKVQ